MYQTRLGKHFYKVLSRHIGKVTKAHVKAALHVLKYLKYTKTLGLLVKPTKDPTFKIYADSSFADSKDYSSTSGWMITLYDVPVLWKCKLESSRTLQHSHQQLQDLNFDQKQNATCGAEYMSCSKGVEDGHFIKNLAEEFGLPLKYPALLLNDNAAAVGIMLRGNPAQSKLRHINRRIHYLVFESIVRGVIKVQYVPTNEQHLTC